MPHRLPRAWPLLALLAGLSLVVAACSSTVQSSPPSSAPPSGAPVHPVSWTTCPNDASLQCGSLVVPLDYTHPDGAPITLALTRAPALGSAAEQGTLIVNPGGPGESGNEILPVVLGLLPPAVRQQYNVVSFDPRGTGSSQPLRCGTSPSALTSALPVPTDGGPLPGTPVFTEMAEACQRLHGQQTPFINSTNTARDMDQIRQALGLKTISFYGLSYGTLLGAVYAELFPSRVGAMVLDGAVDVNASLTRQASQQAPAAERSLDHLLSTCAATPSCPLGPDPTTFYRSLATALVANPLPAPGSGDTSPVTVGDLDTATLFAISVPTFTPAYYSALVSATGGNGAPLRSLALQLATDVNGQPLVDPLWAITCNDAAVHPGPRAAGTQARSLVSRYPLIGGFAVNYAMGGCVAWPTSTHPVANVHPSKAPPTLVLGNTGDPNTPLIGAQHLATIFPTSRLATWDGWGHTWLLSGASDTCMQQVVSAYLVGGHLPAPGTVCH